MKSALQEIWTLDIWQQIILAAKIIWYILLWWLNEQSYRFNHGGCSGSVKPLDDEEIVAILLVSRPETYSGRVTALEGRDEVDITIDYVTRKILDEYQRRIENYVIDKCKMGNALLQRLWKVVIIIEIKREWNMVLQNNSRHWYYSFSGRWLFSERSRSLGRLAGSQCILPRNKIKKVFVQNVLYIL